jgi:ribosome-binding protein aMBF1 (putative translation factor)
MPARKTAEESVKANSALPGKEIRKFETVALEIRRLREEEGMNHEEIKQVLQVSTDVVNQLFLQSYKMSMNTFEVFEAQEKIRLGME